MTYDEATDTVISRRIARLEIERHGCCWEEFLLEVGDKEWYDGADILDWLGY